MKRGKESEINGGMGGWEVDNSKKLLIITCRSKEPVLPTNVSLNQLHCTCTKVHIGTLYIYMYKYR